MTTGIAVVRPGEGRSRWMLGALIDLLVTGEDSGGAFALWEQSEPPGSGPPPHVHTREHETFYVLEGEYAFFGEQGRVEAGPGSLVFVPKGAVHTTRNVGKGPGKMLVLVAPAGFEGFFLEAGDPVADRAAAPPPANEAKARAAAPRYGMDVRELD